MKKNRKSKEFQLAVACLIWAATPDDHGGNPYRHRFMTLAWEVVKEYGISEDTGLDELAAMVE